MCVCVCVCTCVHVRIHVRVCMSVCMYAYVCVHNYKLIQFTIIILDVDECASGVHNCKSNEYCDNKPGRFVCKCLNGYKSVNDVCEGTQLNTELIDCTQ